MRFFILLLLIVISVPVHAQVGYGYPYNQRRGSGLPRGPEQRPEEAKPLTAEEIVEKQMPMILEAVELNPFEEAVVRSILTKNVQKRIELQILELDQETTREALERIKREQDEELEQSLSPEKFEAFMSLYENGKKTRKKKRKKNKSKT